MSSPRNRGIRRLGGFTRLPRRRPRFLAALTTGFLLAGVTGAVAGGPPAAPRSPAPAGSEPAPDPGGLGLALGGLLGRALDGTGLLAPATLGRLRVPGDVRILVVSSGADQATF